MSNGGYDPKTDGSLAIWWTKWMFVGIFIALGFCVYLMHLANVRVAEEREERERQGNEKYEVTTPSRP